MSDDDPKPTPPVEPEAEECCGSGCVRCVFDVYEDAVERYREALAAWERRQGNSSDP
ncbi:MAG TPA: oxidoreductase-like domain-containing protein [Dokdonella sp.]|uniref:oxidoreductase-like domain-containing protein n=1 Tax=Dokdonella sp. TaxID=2291710 RepID=UPI002D7F66DB|nr:oxidoreductase-like domain-containing protein [Dokdonella sp.]HET9033692.1 oxidoreductase-like domain-containing protein [Dokdonella sp.]